MIALCKVLLFPSIQRRVQDFKLCGLLDYYQIRPEPVWLSSRTFKARINIEIELEEKKSFRVAGIDCSALSLC